MSANAARIERDDDDIETPSPEAETLAGFVADAKRAIAFRDAVAVATEAERIAAGSDSHKWIESIVERLAALDAPCTVSD